jgi:hypothetical protein
VASVALINGIFGDRARSEPGRMVVALIICGRRTATSSMDGSIGGAVTSHLPSRGNGVGGEAEEDEHVLVH